jgi:mevalonate kinase
MVHGDKKLGFGSSASVAALTAWAIEQCWVADGFRLGSKEVLALAMEGHRHAQGHRGSGADVAVAALALRMGAADHKPLYLYYCMGDGEAGSPTTTVLRPPSGLSLLAVWTGVCADTRAIMREVDEAARACPGDFGVLMSQMDRLTRDALRAWRAGKIAKLLGFVEPFTWALAELGGLSFVELVTPEHTAISKIVESEAGDAAAAKPSGAGGGDMTIVLCRDAVAGRVSRALTDRGYHVIDLGPTSSASGS